MLAYNTRNGRFFPALRQKVTVTVDLEGTGKPYPTMRLPRERSDEGSAFGSFKKSRSLATLGMTDAEDFHPQSVSQRPHATLGIAGVDLARSQFVDGVERRIVRIAVQLEAQFLAHAQHLHVLGKDVTGHPAQFFLARDVEKAPQ